MHVSLTKNNRDINGHYQFRHKSVSPSIRPNFNVSKYLARALRASLLDSANFPGSSANCEAVIKPENTYNSVKPKKKKKCKCLPALSWDNLKWGLSRERSDKRHGSENSSQSSPKTQTTYRDWQKTRYLLVFFATVTCLTKQATDRVVNERRSDTRQPLGRPLKWHRARKKSVLLQFKRHLCGSNV